jgi:hypothetical protein
MTTMLSTREFLDLVRCADSDQTLLARIALNALHDPARFPVDMSELMSLTAHHRALVRSFLAWCAVHPEEYTNWPDDLLTDVVDQAMPEDGCASN